VEIYQLHLPFQMKFINSICSRYQHAHGTTFHSFLCGVDISVVTCLIAFVRISFCFRTALPESRILPSTIYVNVQLTCLLCFQPHDMIAVFLDNIFLDVFFFNFSCFRTADSSMTSDPLQGTQPETVSANSISSSPFSGENIVTQLNGKRLPR
jgi:hypothetical protein